MANWWETDKQGSTASTDQGWWSGDKSMQEAYEAKPWYAKLGIAADDIVRLTAEGATRGGLDKLLGPEEQAKTQAAQARAGLAGDVAQITGAYAAMPYRVGSTLAGVGYGGLEGGVSAYLHQPNWIPTTEQDKQILWETVKGAGLGGAGAKAGEWLGKGWSALTGSNVPYSGPQSVVSKIGEAVKPVADMPLTNTILADSLLAHVGMPGVVTGAKTVAKGANWLGNTRLFNPTTMANPAASEAARDAFAKMMIGYGNRP
jgi:hypothetical protein